ncbi:TetR family transcriptional regulator [Streptomyces sp. NPDC054796]
MRQERAERTRYALTLAAAKLFDQVGVERATLSEVSRTAAVSKGALSFHFQSKADLAVTVQELACQHAEQRVEELRARDLPALQTLIDLSHLVAHQLTHDYIVRAWREVAEHQRESDCSVSPTLHLFHNWQRRFVEVAVEAQQDHSLRPDTDPRTTAHTALSLSAGQQILQGDPVAGVRARLTEAWELILPSLVAPLSPWPLRAQGSEDSFGAGLGDDPLPLVPAARRAS